MARRVVVLPAPLAPMRHTSSPCSTVEVDALHGADAAVGDLDLSSASRGSWGVTRGQRSLEHADERG